MKATTPHTIWLIPAVFDRVWRDERHYVICEQFRGLAEGVSLLIEEGDEDGTRSGRNMRARVEVVSIEACVTSYAPYAALIERQPDHSHFHGHCVCQRPCRGCGQTSSQTSSQVVCP